MRRGKVAKLAKMRSYGCFCERCRHPAQMRRFGRPDPKNTDFIGYVRPERAVFAETRYFCEYKILSKGDFTVNEWLLGGL